MSLTLEHRAKLSEIGKTKRGSKNSFFGRKHSAVTRARWSAARKGDKHALKTRKKMSDSHTGKKFSDEHIASMRERAKKHTALDLPNCNCVVHAKMHRFRSQLEKRMIDSFLSEFPEVISEKRFGRYTVDAYLPPPYHLAFEADGIYWHSLRPEYDEERDAWLLEHVQLPVIRLSEEEINSAAKETHN